MGTAANHESGQDPIVTEVIGKEVAQAIQAIQEDLVFDGEIEVAQRTQKRLANQGIGMDLVDIRAVVEHRIGQVPLVDPAAEAFLQETATRAVDSAKKTSDYAIPPLIAMSVRKTIREKFPKCPVPASRVASVVFPLFGFESPRNMLMAAGRTLRQGPDAKDEFEKRFTHSPRD